VACSFSLFAIIVRFDKMHSKCNELEQAIALKTDSIREIIKVIEEVNLIGNYKVENLSVTNTITNEPLKLYDLFTKFHYFIIYRLVNTGCSSCNKKQIEMLNYLQKDNNIIILSYANNARQLRLFSSEIENKSIIYQVDSSHKLFKCDDSTKVLIMYVNNSGTILRAYLLNEEILFLIKHIVS
jgi:hypothetical protein